MDFGHKGTWTHFTCFFPCYLYQCSWLFLHGGPQLPHLYNEHTTNLVRMRKHVCLGWRESVNFDSDHYNFPVLL